MTCSARESTPLIFMMVPEKGAKKETRKMSIHEISVCLRLSSIKRRREKHIVSFYQRHSIRNEKRNENKKHDNQQNQNFLPPSSYHLRSLCDSISLYRKFFVSPFHLVGRIKKFCIPEKFVKFFNLKCGHNFKPHFLTLTMLPKVMVCDKNTWYSLMQHSSVQHKAEVTQTTHKSLRYSRILRHRDENHFISTSGPSTTKEIKNHNEDSERMLRN